MPVNAPSGDMKAGEMNPLWMEMRRRALNPPTTYPMPPAQWMPPMGPRPLYDVINPNKVPYLPHPLPQGSGVIRGQTPIPNLGETFSDTPGGIYALPSKSVNSTWMDVMRNRAGGTSKESGYDPWLLDYLRKKFGLKDAELEQLFMKNDEIYKLFGSQPRDI